MMDHQLYDTLVSLYRQPGTKGRDEWMRFGLVGLMLNDIVGGSHRKLSSDGMPVKPTDDEVRTLVADLKRALDGLTKDHPEFVKRT